VVGLEAIFKFIATHWKSIMVLLGLTVAGATAYSLAGAVLQAQPAFVQAIQITAYAIPVLVYSLVIQFIFQMISTIREFFRR
jgi:hypothetical protein